MSRIPPRRWPRLALVLAAMVVLGTGCQVETHVGVEVEGDGSGLVSVAVGLDEAAARRVPELADQMEVTDLEATGWTVTGPAPEGDGRTWVRAWKPFPAVEEAAPILAEVSGPRGPFHDLRVVRVPTLVHDVWRFTGTVDLTAGLGAFSDDALRERLDGTDIGMPAEDVATSAGRPIEEVFTFRVAVDLPGRMTSHTPVDTSGPAVWEPGLGERTTLAASGRRFNREALLWLAIAAAAVAAASARFILQVRRRRRSGAVPFGR